MAGAAQASTTTVNVAGVGAVATLDWLPGSTYAAGGSTGSGTNNFPVYFQSSLGSFVGADNNAINGTGLGSSYYVTAVIGFRESGTFSTAGNGSSALFSGAGGDSYVKFFKTNMAPDAVSGNGYAPATALTGQTFTQILSATILKSSVFGVFASPNSLRGTYGNLDQHGTNDWATSGPGGASQLSVNGGGATSVSAVINSYDNTFFTDPLMGILNFSMLFTTENSLPFLQADPSKLVYDGFTNAGLVTEGTLGAVNGNIAGRGTGNILFQTDASNSFEAVPEPSTFVLSGLGLLLAGGYLRRRRNA